MERISIIGAGSWGTALAAHMGKKGFSISIWDRNHELLKSMESSKENTRYLPGVTIPQCVGTEPDIEECVRESKIIIIGVPSHAVREVCRKIKSIAGSKRTIVSIAKGIEKDTYLRMSELIDEELPGNDICVLSGPSHAEEVSRGIPTAVVSSSRKKETAEYVQDLFMTPEFRIYTNPDIVGVELGGATKNIIALAAGISDGLGFGDNTKALLMTRGISEMARLGTAMGADTFTFAGLSGIGDLIVTCTSMHSRNRRAGILIGQGKSVEEALKEVRMVVEGVNAADAARGLSRKHGVEMPITEMLCKVLFEGKDPRDAVFELMARAKTGEMHEYEEIVEREQKYWEQ
jgi:glycerol-3-phosphate dehydrogenase (NAD(P)+)